MKRLLFIRLSLLFMVAAFTFIACDKEEEGTEDIFVQNSSSQTQTVFADDEQGYSDVSFTTTGAWTSSIFMQTSNTPSGSLKAASDNTTPWIFISPDAGKEAGDYTIEISLIPNTTGVDRTAVINIWCNGTNVTINVTQKGLKEDGTIPEEPQQPEEPELSTGMVKKINGQVVSYTSDSIFAAIGLKSHFNKQANQWNYLVWNTERGETSCYYEYGSNGYISKTEANIYLRYGDSNTTRRVAEFYWNNNELSYVRGDQVAVERGDAYLRTDFEYGDTEYTLGNIDINWLLGTHEYYTGLPASAIGIQTTKNHKLLIKKTQVEEIGDGKYDAISTYRYVFNEDGYITEIYETINTGGSEARIYIFEY